MTAGHHAAAQDAIALPSENESMAIATGSYRYVRRRTKITKIVARLAEAKAQEDVTARIEARERREKSRALASPVSLSTILRGASSGRYSNSVVVPHENASPDCKSEPEELSPAFLALIELTTRGATGPFDNASDGVTAVSSAAVLSLDGPGGGSDGEMSSSRPTVSGVFRRACEQQMVVEAKEHIIEEAEGRRRGAASKRVRSLSGDASSPRKKLLAPIVGTPVVAPSPVWRYSTDALPPSPRCAATASARARTAIDDERLPTARELALCHASLRFLRAGRERQFAAAFYLQSWWRRERGGREATAGSPPARGATTRGAHGGASSPLAALDHRRARNVNARVRLPSLP